MLIFLPLCLYILKKNLVSPEKRFGELCNSNFIRLLAVLHQNIGSAVLDPKCHDEIKSELKNELNHLNLF